MAGLFTTLSGCSLEPTPSPIAITYSLSVGGTARIDSVKYDDGAGNLMLIVDPGTTWLTRVSARRGRTVEARAWGIARINGRATLTATWTTLLFGAPETSVHDAGGNIFPADSTVLALAITRRQI